MFLYFKQNQRKKFILAVNIQQHSIIILRSRQFQCKITSKFIGFFFGIDTVLCVVQDKACSHNVGVVNNLHVPDAVCSGYLDLRVQFQKLLSCQWKRKTNQKQVYNDSSKHYKKVHETVLVTEEHLISFVSCT